MMNTDAPDVTDGHPGGTRDVSPALDDTLDLLANRRRRYVLYCLREDGGSVALEDLAEQVATWEGNAEERGSPQSNGRPDEKSVLADLYHSQLPRLEDAGVVSFDFETEYVSLDDDADDDMPIREYLDLAAAEEKLA